MINYNLLMSQEIVEFLLTVVCTSRLLTRPTPDVSPCVCCYQALPIHRGGWGEGEGLDRGVQFRLEFLSTATLLKVLNGRKIVSSSVLRGIQKSIFLKAKNIAEFTQNAHYLRDM